MIGPITFYFLGLHVSLGYKLIMLQILNTKDQILKYSFSVNELIYIKPWLSQDMHFSLSFIIIALVHKALAHLDLLFYIS